MQNVEKQLDDMLVKKAPFQLPENARKGLASAMPWLTLIGGVLMLWAAWGMWQLVTWADNWVGLANSLSAYYGTSYTSPVGSSPLLWLSLVVLLAEAVLFFVAFPALRAYRKSGWNILFWVALVNLVEAVLQAIAYTNFGSLIMSLLGSLVGLYLLFQIRAYYTGEKKMAPAASAPKPTDQASTPPADKKE